MCPSQPAQERSETDVSQQYRQIEISKFTFGMTDNMLHAIFA